MVDTIAIVEDALIEHISMSNAGKTFLLLEQGSKTEATSLSTHCGGGAVNASVALARLGHAVSIIAKVGEDSRANVVRQALIAEGISLDGLVATQTAPTGASAIVAAHDRNAAVFTFRGSNTTLTDEDIQKTLIDAADLIYVSTLSGASADVLPKVIDLARSPRRMIVVNPGLRQITTRFSALLNALPDLSVLALNRAEAEAFARQAIAELAGSENAMLRQIVAMRLATSIGADRQMRHVSAAALIDGLLYLGAKSVLLTDGMHGAYIGDRDQIIFCPALDVAVVSSAGAGDAFVSTFAGVLAGGHDYAYALRAASVNASAVVTEADSQSGLLRKEFLHSRTDAHQHILPITRISTSTA